MPGTGIIYSEKYLPNGRVSEELEERVDAALDDFSAIACNLIKLGKGNMTDYLVQQVYVVGSLLQGVDDSDVDLYIKTKNTDIGGIQNYKTISDFIKVHSFGVLCKNKPKTEWIDLYIGTSGPSKEHFEQKYNQLIMNPEVDLLESKSF